MCRRPVGGLFLVDDSADNALRKYRHDLRKAGGDAIFYTGWVGQTGGGTEAAGGTVPPESSDTAFTLRQRNIEA